MSIDLPNKADDYVKFPDLSVESDNKNKMFSVMGCLVIITYKNGIVFELLTPPSPHMYKQYQQV